MAIRNGDRTSFSRSDLEEKVRNGRGRNSTLPEGYPISTGGRSRQLEFVEKGARRGQEQERRKAGMQTARTGPGSAPLLRSARERTVFTDRFRHGAEDARRKNDENKKNSRTPW